MRVTFYGVRGSTPCHGTDIARYGGNTSCVVLEAQGEPPLVFDLGTGLRYFGRTSPNDGSFRGSCLLSHLHWDHTQGLPFFTPLLCGGAELDVYAPTPADGGSVGEVFAAMICPPMFPINIAYFPGTVRFHDLEEGVMNLGGLKVLAREIPHVGRTYGYRVEFGGRSVAYLPDHQQPFDGSFSVSPGALELAAGVDLLIHDSQYTPAEFAKKATWGHCTAEYALWLAGHAGVKRLALFHHDPNRSDDALDEFARCAQTNGRLDFELFTAAQGMTVQV
ncbi:MAG: MBL fold metallo-hydrolase [Ilumatobacteraceae bacterium]